MDFLDVMQVYFRGEKLEAAWFILPLGLALVGLGAVALKVETGGFAWGIAVPSAIFGLVLISIGAGIALRTSGQVADLEAGYQEAPAAMVAEELPRMQKVNANFHSTFLVGGVLTAVGLILLFAVRTDWSHGVGAVLILACALLFLIDGFASRRAVPYTAALEQLAQEHDVAPRSNSR